jgi:hypothetical protein
MGAYYCDSSALVKRYANEPGTLWVRSLTDPQAGHDIFTAHITGIEVVAAIARKTRLREIAVPDATTAIRTFKSHFTTQYQIVLMTTGLVIARWSWRKNTGSEGTMPHNWRVH